jgi:hypothetical protein
MPIFKRPDIMLKDPLKVLTKEVFMRRFWVHDIIEKAENLSGATVYFQDSPRDKSRGFILRKGPRDRGTEL